uniref:Uncharacterized protein n=1 Tax=Rhabditophanes sp. KR3021 TaxID=114890 RepID=A0AC35UGI6_9BILA
MNEPCLSKILKPPSTPSTLNLRGAISSSTSKLSLSTPASPSIFPEPCSPISANFPAKHGRVMKIRRDATSAIKDEFNHERLLQTSQKVSISLEEFCIDDNITEIRKRAKSLTEPISVLTNNVFLPQPCASSKASTETSTSSIQKQCYSPSTNKIVKSNLPYSPSPSPTPTHSPTRHRILRSCSPKTSFVNKSNSYYDSYSTMSGLKRKRCDTSYSLSSNHNSHDSDSESTSSSISNNSSPSRISTLFPSKKAKLSRNCPSPLTKISSSPSPISHEYSNCSFSNFNGNDISMKDVMDFQNETQSLSNNGTSSRLTFQSNSLTTSLEKFNKECKKLKKPFAQPELVTSHQSFCVEKGNKESAVENDKQTSLDSKLSSHLITNSTDPPFFTSTFTSPHNFHSQTNSIYQVPQE